MNAHYGIGPYVFRIGGVSGALNPNANILITSILMKA